MDSLTQIVLGAAVGEVVLGKKIGNRAMVWGAIGGTIPDLDVIANFFMNDLDALAVHRGITHSISFAIVIPFLLGWLVHGLYARGIYRRKWYKGITAGLNILLLGLVVYILFGLLSIPGRIGICLLGICLAVYLVKNYLLSDLASVHARYRDWYWLFFWAFLTHLLLDVCTAYGTQVFLPFSEYRLALNVIAVADPAYTVPFLTLLIAAAILKRDDPARRFANWLGIGLSLLYMLVCVYTKNKVDAVFAAALEYRNIEAQRCQASPTIFNNILWNCLAETEDAFYVGLYSIYDTDPNLHVLNRLPKRKDLVEEYGGYEEYQTLEWFANGYLHATTSGSELLLMDLRFGATRDTIDSADDFVFRFYADPKEGGLEVREDRRRPENFWEELRVFIERVRGY